jgi:hypothetical protein
MPVKWKIFSVINFIMSVSALGLTILLIIGLSNIKNYRSEDYLWGSVFGFACLAITLNDFLNVYIMQRFFPDQLISPVVKGLNRLSLIINLLVVGGMIVLCVSVANDLFAGSSRDSDHRAIIVFIVTCSALVIQAVILVVQMRLPRLITRNNQERMNSLIDLIGQ